MDRMVNDLKDGETYIYANSRDEYDAFVGWLHENGGEFSYHFETGEGYWWKGRIIEVNGL